MTEHQSAPPSGTQPIVTRQQWGVLGAVGVLVVIGIVLGATVSAVLGGAVVALCGLALAGITLWVAGNGRR